MFGDPQPLSEPINLSFAKPEEAPITLVAQGRALGRGEPVTLDNELAIRITDWHPSPDRTHFDMSITASNPAYRVWLFVLLASLAPFPCLCTRPMTLEEGIEEEVVEQAPPEVENPEAAEPVEPAEPEKQGELAGTDLLKEQPKKQGAQEQLDDLPDFGAALIRMVIVLVAMIVLMLVLVEAAAALAVEASAKCGQADARGGPYAGRAGAIAFGRAHRRAVPVNGQRQRGAAPGGDRGDRSGRPACRVRCGSG